MLEFEFQCEYVFEDVIEKEIVFFMFDIVYEVVDVDFIQLLDELVLDENFVENCGFEEN